MSEPTSAAEYTQRYHQHELLSGRGLEVTMHLPCFFCAAPEFLVYKILDVNDVLANGGTCRACGRSARALVTNIRGGQHVEMVQTGGPEQPEWLTPKMRVVLKD